MFDYNFFDMNKMYVLLILTTIISCTQLKGQDPYDELIQTFDDYRSLIKQKKYDKAFDYYQQTFLKYVPREQLKKQISEIHSNKNFKVQASNSEIVFLSEIIKDSANNQYAFLRYTSYNQFKFTDEASEEYKTRIKKMFQDSFGEKASYFENEDKVSFSRDGEFVAVKIDNDWRFVLYKKKLRPYMHLWIPQEILNMLVFIKNGKNMVNRK
ncbi:hypothetical protein [Mangrovivirga cuniculi]|uniref:Uncharacterized protein n=1 Tax=Mangrovivirga cuniculi TaxID=2715131 RepID=A0A4D7JJF6_9BACT|nr:hypothetical protein [Mangrovivirga cuniculi]QCK15731.1 hypothetical protein DCC35_13750 [Mangrovivirga cuniculi]